MLHGQRVAAAVVAVDDVEHEMDDDTSGAGCSATRARVGLALMMMAVRRVLQMRVRGVQLQLLVLSLEDPIVLPV